MTQQLPTLSLPRSCRLCQQSLVKRVGQKKSAYSKIVFELLECESCGFLFVTPVVDPRSVYTPGYYKGEGVDPLINYDEDFNDPFGGSRSHEFKNVLKIVEEVKGKREKIRWLDFGCGNGALLKFLKDQKDLQITASGFDESEPSQKLKALGYEIFDRKALESLTGTFDVITCLEVIEHVVHPKEVIEAISKLLKPGGLLFLTTGNMDSPMAKLRGFNFSYCVPEIHISLFKPQVLGQLYKSFDLKPVRFRFPGIIKFKILKNLGVRLSKVKFFAFLAGLGPVTLLFDWLFGVSKIPCAVKGPWHDEGSERKS